MHITNQLFLNQDNNYREFSKRLITTKYEILGVRLPRLRTIVKQASLEELEQFFNNDVTYHEEVLIKIIYITSKLDNICAIFNYVDKILPVIDNWCTCDCLGSGLKRIITAKDYWWEKLDDYLKSDKEFYLRLVLVIYLNYFLEDKYIDDILVIINKIEYRHYYVMMAGAWLLATAFIKYPDKITQFLLTPNLNVELKNKAIQKINESLRVSKSAKIQIKTLKNNKNNDIISVE